MKNHLFLFLIIFSMIHWSILYVINKENQNDSAIIRESSNFKNFVGSNLFDGVRKNCFSQEDINLLVARRDFEVMIPKEFPPGLLDDKGVKQVLRYFYYGFFLFRRLEDGRSRRVMEKAFYDTLGGFMRHYLVPVSKYSYYASKVELRTMRNVLALYEKSRVFLNTNGNGWRIPIKNPLAELKTIKINSIKITDNKLWDSENSCRNLDLTTASNSAAELDDKNIISLPKIEQKDNEGRLSNIWLPFSKKRTYNLRSEKSAFILVKYYRSVIRCYKKKSLTTKDFNRKFRQWILENVKVHLDDEQFYPGLGGVLNIYANTNLSENGNGNKDDDLADINERKKRWDGIMDLFNDDIFRTEPVKDEELSNDEASAFKGTGLEYVTYQNCASESMKITPKPTNPPILATCVPVLKTTKSTEYHRTKTTCSIVTSVGSTTTSTMKTPTKIKEDSITVKDCIKNILILIVIFFSLCALYKRLKAKLSKENKLPFTGTLPNLKNCEEKAKKPKCGMKATKDKKQEKKLKKTKNDKKKCKELKKAEAKKARAAKKAAKKAALAEMRRKRIAKSGRSTSSAESRGFCRTRNAKKKSLENEC